MSAKHTPRPSEPGGFVGDIFFGDPDNCTRGTHRWDGSAWIELQDERVTMLGMLADAREQRDALLGALIDTLDFLERHSNRWDGVNGKHPQVSSARTGCIPRSVAFSCHGCSMSDRFSTSKYLMVLAHDSIQKATTDLVDALIKDEQGSIGARLIDAEKRLTLALTDIAKAFAALERK